MIVKVYTIQLWKEHRFLGFLLLCKKMMMPVMPADPTQFGIPNYYFLIKEEVTLFSWHPIYGIWYMAYDIGYYQVS